MRFSRCFSGVGTRRSPSSVMAFVPGEVPTKRWPKPKSILNKVMTWWWISIWRSFFDQVCHDRLMSRLAERIPDKRLLKLIRGYLQAGILAEGLVIQPETGTPQGSPLSPFLSTTVLE